MPISVDVYIQNEFFTSSKLDIDPDASSDLYFIAAAPYDRRQSSHGSCLPFPNYALAFEGSKNKGVATRSIEVEREDRDRPQDNGEDSGGTMKYSVNLCSMPNTFYASGGRVIVPPTVYVRIANKAGRVKEYSIKLTCGLRNKVLNYPRSRNRLGPLFYDNVDSLPIRSQEMILAESSISADRSPFEFWGGKPAR